MTSFYTIIEHTNMIESIIQVTQLLRKHGQYYAILGTPEVQASNLVIIGIILLF